jgi:hypothetical protein
VNKAVETVESIEEEELRKIKLENDSVEKKLAHSVKDDSEKESEKESIDLSFLLNLLDGTLEANGRILIITTNFPERIDRALIRPGRIDMIVKFKHCNRAVIREMLDSFYDKPVELPEDASLDYKWSPAEVNQILFRNFNQPDAAVQELLTLTREDLCGFADENGLTIPTVEDVAQ